MGILSLVISIILLVIFSSLILAFKRPYIPPIDIGDDDLLPPEDVYYPPEEDDDLIPPEDVYYPPDEIYYDDEEYLYYEPFSNECSNC
jgi:hypothetical protein